MSYTIEKAGGVVDNNLVGIDRPQEVDKMYDRLTKWLDGK